MKANYDIFWQFSKKITSIMTTVLKKGSILHKSSPFLAMLTKDFTLTHCSYCFKKMNHINFKGKIIFLEFFCTIYNEFFSFVMMSFPCWKTSLKVTKNLFWFCFFVAACSKCTVANYCSSECQDRDSEIHQFECQLYGKCLPVFDAVRMMIRLLNKLYHANGWEDYDLVYGGKKRHFKDLLSHKDEMFKDNSTFHAIQGVHRITQDYLGKDQVPDLDQFAEIYGKMAINGFEICDEMGNNRY